jgi:uracil-DNA glycosylase
MGHFGDVLEEIWQNWHNRESESPCGQCPHWGAGGGKAPFYGVDSISDETDVLLVGKEPGTASDPADAKNVKEYILETYPEHFGDYRTEKIEDTGMYEKYSNNLVPLVSLFRIQNIEFNFTNVKKCRETNDGNTDEAIETCSPYLYREIDSLSPSVIVTLGSEATKQVYDRFPEVYEDYDIPSGISSAKTPTSVEEITKDALKPRQCCGMTIISSVHFSHLGPNLKHVPTIPDEKDIPAEKNLSQKERVAMYWTTLIDAIEEHV